MKGTKNGVRGKAAAVAAVSAALLIPLATFGGPALARSGAALAEYQYGSGKTQYRVVICHITGSKKKSAHTITVSSSAVRAHLRHGDHLGACTGTELRRGKHQNQGAPGKNQGAPGNQSGDHGNGKGHKGK